MPSRAVLQDIINALAEKGSITKTQSDKFCRYFFNVIREVLLRDSYVKIKGLGTFKLMTVNERESVDVNTGHRIEISAHQRIVFTPDKSIASRVNRPFENFETIDLDGPDKLEQDSAEEVVAQAAAVMNASQDDDGEDTVHSVFLGEVNVGEEPSDVTKESQEASVVAEDNVTDEMPQEDIPSEDQQETEAFPDDVYTEDIASRRPWWKTVGCVLLSMFMLVAAYFMGYYKLFGDTDICGLYKQLFVADTSGVNAEIRETVKTDTLVQKNDTAVAEIEKQVNWKAEAEKYEQLEGADYLIVGDMEIHEMKNGENVIRLSQKLYGSKDMAKYVIFHNHISNPDLVHVGRKIVFPKLMKAEEVYN